MALEPGEEGPEDPVDAEEAEVLDPSTPFIDKTAAGPQIAAPGGEAPELADADETLAGAPNAAPAAPVGSVVTPPPAAATTPQEAGAGAFGASQEEIQALKDRAAAGQELDENERQRLAQATADDANIRVQRELEAQSQKDARDEYIAKKNAADEKVRDFKFHDYFDDPKHGSKTLARFAVFLGGLGNLGGQAPGSPNRAFDGLEENIKADHDTQLAYLNSAKYFAEKQGEGVTDLLKQQASDRAQAELDYSNKKLATADKFAELAQTARGKQNYDAAMIEVAKLKKSAYDDQQKVFGDIAKQHLEDLQGKAALARANRYAHKVGGGGGGSAGSAAALASELQAHPEYTLADQYKAAAKLGIPAKAKAGRVSLDTVLADIASGRKQTDKTAAVTAKQQASNDKDTVRVGGVPLGLVPSGRGGAVAYSKLLEGYNDSITSVKDLLSYVEQNPKKAAVLGTHGDAFHRAVLALQATSTANATDTTTKHEAESLKNMGFLNADAIRTTLKHLEDRNKAYRSDLRPIPGSEGKPSAKASEVLDKLASLGFQ